MIGTGELEDKRRKQSLDWMWSLLEEGLKFRFYKNAKIAKLLPEITHAVKDGRTSPTVAASKLLLMLDPQGNIDFSS